MMKQLKMVMDELEVYQKDDSNVNFMAVGGYDGNDDIEIVQFTENSPYILRIKMYERYGEFWTINVRKMSKKKYVFFFLFKRRDYNQ